MDKTTRSRPFRRRQAMADPGTRGGKTLDIRHNSLVVLVRYTLSKTRRFREARGKERETWHIQAQMLI